VPLRSKILVVSNQHPYCHIRSCFRGSTVQGTPNQIIGGSTQYIYNIYSITNGRTTVIPNETCIGQVSVRIRCAFYGNEYDLYRSCCVVLGVLAWFAGPYGRAPRIKRTRNGFPRSAMRYPLRISHTISVHGPF
jgi:hypothetical protein